jgi:hypothetical protein
MANKDSADPKLEVGHVLFMDIVGYSKLLIHYKQFAGGSHNIKRAIAKTVEVKGSVQERL